MLQSKSEAKRLAVQNKPMTTAQPSTDDGAKPSEKSTKEKAVLSADAILAANLSEHGFIHITYTVPGAAVEFSSARPVTTLSRFLQDLGVEFTSPPPSGDDSEDSSEKDSLDIPPIDRTEMLRKLHPRIRGGLVQPPHWPGR